MNHLIKNDIPVWAKEKEILDILKDCRLKRDQKDFYFVQVLDRLLTRLELLEDNQDELIAEEK